MQNDIEEQLLPVRAVAELLHVKESTIPHMRIGKTIRFRKTEVLQWLEENAKKGKTN